MREQGTLTADWYHIKLSDHNDFSNIKYPCVVKPCSGGSSVGVNIVENKINK